MTPEDISTALDEAETAAPPPPRRVVQEKEKRIECDCRWNGHPSNINFAPAPKADCPQCVGTGTRWTVTSRTVQIGVPYNEQAMVAYIHNLHLHIRRAAATVDQAAEMLQKAGRLAEAAGMSRAAQAILDGVPQEAL